MYFLIIHIYKVRQLAPSVVGEKKFCTKELTDVDLFNNFPGFLINHEFKIYTRKIHILFQFPDTERMEHAAGTLYSEIQ